MKKLINYCLAIFVSACVCAACNTEPVKNDKEVSIVIDLSDPLKVNPDADDLYTQLGLKENIFQGIKVNVTAISDKDVNAQKVIILKKGDRLTGNIQLRTIEVAQFKKELRTALSGAHATGSLEHSIIYRTVAKQLSQLSASSAMNRYLLVYSDLMENNDSISFYQPETLVLLHSKPDAIGKQFEKSAALNSLIGVQVWVLYEPESFKDNNTFMPIARLYKHVLESKGAMVHIENTLNL